MGFKSSGKSIQPSFKISKTWLLTNELLLTSDKHHLKRLPSGDFLRSILFYNLMSSKASIMIMEGEIATCLIQIYLSHSKHKNWTLCHFTL